MELYQLLVSIGDMLDATDDVEERNDVGFNKADKHFWQQVRTDSKDNVMNLLYKYQAQIKMRWPDLAAQIPEWKITSNAKEERARIMKAATEERAKKAREERAAAAAKKKADLLEEQNNFPVKIVLAHFNVNQGLQALGFDDDLKRSCKTKYDKIFKVHLSMRPLAKGHNINGNWIWVFSYKTDFQKYREELTAIGVELEMPELDPAVLSRKEYEVMVGLREDGTMTVKHPYSEVMNSAYRNAEETSGIIGFDWDEKVRLVGKDEFHNLDEVLASLKKNHPTWEVGYNFDIQKVRSEYEDRKAFIRKITDDVTRKLNPGIVPLPYQVEGYRFLESMDGNAINGDDMGLGKTFQTLLWQANYEKRSLVVAPKNVRRQWLQECDKFFLPGVFKGLELDSKTPQNVSFEGYNIVTCNYEILKKFEAQIVAAGFDLLVLDESHRIKNPKAAITQLCQRIALNFKHKVLLSGTAVKNKKKEIFTQANLVMPGLFNSEGQVNMMTFFNCKEAMKKFFFRRTKKVELKDLPPKLRSVVKLDFNKELPDYKPGMEIGEISSLNSALAIAKVPMTIDFVQEMLDGSDSKIIVFSASDDAAQLIADHFGKLAVLHVGSTPHEKREKAKLAYNDEESEVRLFVATIGSAREGLNLQVADKVVFNDLPWTPADVCQGEDRAWRMGQKVAVNVYWICAAGNAFDEGKVQLIYDKMAVFDKLINAKKPTKASEGEEMSVLQALKKVLAKA